MELASLTHLHIRATFPLSGMPPWLQTRLDPLFVLHSGPLSITQALTAPICKYLEATSLLVWNRAVHGNSTFKVTISVRWESEQNDLLAISTRALFWTKSLVIKPLTQKQSEPMVSSDYKLKVFCPLHPECLHTGPPGTIWLDLTDRS